MVPYHCLMLRSRKAAERCGETYQDTVRQFNAVVKKVISTVLVGGAEVKMSQRAEILTKWIEIADVSLFDRAARPPSTTSDRSIRRQLVG